MESNEQNKLTNKIETEFYIYLQIQIRRYRVLSVSPRYREQTDSCQKGELGGLGKKGEGIKQKKPPKTPFLDNSMAMTRGKREREEVGAGTGGINDEERELHWGW